MDPITIAGASGMRARMESLEMLANNLANGSTAGYKTDREFYSLYVAPEAAAAAVGGAPAGTLPVIERPWTDFTQGAIEPTGNPLDFALAGNGFFAVDGPAGTLYTRNGSFRVSKAGLLETREGFAVKLRAGGKIRVVAGKPLDGTLDGTLSQDGHAVGRLQVVEFGDASKLARQGAGYYLAPDSSAAPTTASAEVRQARLESSNVASAEAAVRLVSVMRQFEMMQKVVTLGAEMNRQAVEEVARV